MLVLFLQFPLFLFSQGKPVKVGSVEFFDYLAGEITDSFHVEDEKTSDKSF